MAQPFTRNPGTERCSLADLLRRCEPFEEVRSTCKPGQEKNAGGKWKPVLQPQLELVEAEDVSHPNASEVFELSEPGAG